jgi:hypothetical protein
MKLEEVFETGVKAGHNLKMRFILKHVCIELPTLPSKTINNKYSTRKSLEQ